MKNTCTLLGVLLLFTFAAAAQSPAKMSYQAVVRDANNRLVVDQVVGMQISILQGTASGTAIYVETQTPATNPNGLVTIAIGGGKVESGDFSTIDWASDLYFVKTEIDPSGGNNYTITGVSQLLSVPYALHANTADSLAGGIVETDPGFVNSVAGGITEKDTMNWNQKLDSYTETQNIADVVAIGNVVNAQLKNVMDPTDEHDAVNKGYVTLKVSVTGDTLFLGPGQWVKIPGISTTNPHFGESFTDDRDGNVYNAVKIGNQIWMAENLRYLPVVTGPDVQSWDIPYYYVYGYNGMDIDEAKATGNYSIFGVLYNALAAMNEEEPSARVQGICPTGWHLPNHSEWTELSDYLTSNEHLAGGKLKESGTTNWLNPNTGANNDTGFTALPGGGSGFTGLGMIGQWWAASKIGSFQFMYYLEHNSDNLFFNLIEPNAASSCRCVKD